MNSLLEDYYEFPRKYRPKIVEKAWGYELIIDNTPEYCGKVLHFNKGGKFSIHFHGEKNESWYVNRGKLQLILIHTINAQKEIIEFNEGDCIRIPHYQPHQLIALEESDVLEVSTRHKDADSYRIEPGNSQDFTPEAIQARRENKNFAGCDSV